MAADVLYMPQAIYDAIIAHARDGKPEEVCGIMRGREDRVFELVRGRNVAPDRVMDYVVDSQTLLRQIDFEEQGDEMVAIYHSHPVSPAYPSASDAWSAHYPDSAYLICSLQGDDAPVLRAFRMTPHPAPRDLDRLRAEIDFDETRPGRFCYYQAAGAALPPVLQATGADVPAPFYVVFELPEQAGKEIYTRVVSIQERHIQIVTG